MCHDLLDALVNQKEAQKQPLSLTNHRIYPPAPHPLVFIVNILYTKHLKDFPLYLFWERTNETQEHEVDRLTNMEAFVRVVEAKSFSEAARQWGRSKAVVSKYVTALEDHLNVTLLHRTTRILRLTDAGEVYYHRCLAFLEELSTLESSLRDEYITPKGTLRISMPPELALRYRTLLLTDFHERFPALSLDLLLTHKLLDIAEEGIDIALRLTEPRDPSLHTRHVLSLPFKLVASPAYLEAHGTPIRPSELEAHACLLDPNMRDLGRWRFKGKSGQREIVDVSGPYRVDNGQLLQELVKEGHGIALLPDYMVHESLEAGRLVSLFEDRVAMDRALYLVYPKKRHTPGRTRAFVDYVVEALRREESNSSASSSRPS